MALIEAELGNALESAVKRKANRTDNLRLTAARLAQGSPEVMVKITGFGKGGNHVKAHLDYISRKGEVEMENERGELFKGKEAVRALFKDWGKDFSDEKRHKNQRDTMHLVLSMPETTDPESVRRGAREFARATFGKNHEYAFALHTDEKHPHCHVTVKCLGFDGKRLNPRKADLQRWREGFAEKMRGQGVNAEATPRRSRGVVKKAERSVIRHIEAGDMTHPPRVSRVRAAKTKEAAAELINEAQGAAAPVKPWEAAIESRQAAIRRAWLAAADALSQRVKLTFNHQEARNERPNYDTLRIEQARHRQRAAAVYQSHLATTGPQASPRPLAGVRNLSSLGVVRHGRPAQVLLRTDASHRVGRDRAADPQMRREGVGTTRPAPGTERLKTAQGTDDRALAERIRAFVSAMPAVETEKQGMKKTLRERFALAGEKTAGRQSSRAPETPARNPPAAPQRDEPEAER